VGALHAPMPRPCSKAKQPDEDELSDISAILAACSLTQNISTQTKRRLGQMTHRRDISTAFGSIVTGTEECDLSRQAIVAFLQGLKRCNIWPSRDHSVPTIKSKLENVAQAVFSTGRNSCPKGFYPSCPCGSPSRLKHTLLIELDKTYDAVQSLCLKCVRHKALGDSKPPCAKFHLTTGAMVHL
jgi:hypothetical protein